MKETKFKAFPLPPGVSWRDQLAEKAMVVLLRNSGINVGSHTEPTKYLEDLKAVAAHAFRMAEAMEAERQRALGNV